MKKIIAACAVLACAVATTACASKPKESYTERVNAFCGVEVARAYSQVKWRDRDYAHDAIIQSCIVFGTKK